MIGGLVLGLLLTSIYPILGLALNAFFGVSALLYFNWYASPVIKFPPLVESHNLIVKDKNSAKKKVVLMAHWDTAPISILYSPSMVGNFRNSLKMNLILIVLAILISVVYLIVPNQIVLWLSWILVVYFIGQLIVASWDFYKFGYSNGASDNATGVGAAVVTAQALWKENLPDLEVELILTGAEEVGMIGAKDYFDKGTWNENTYLINFDTLGAGDLKVFTETGSWGNIVYDNELIKIANDVIATDKSLEHVKLGAWHTADFDSVWFQRAGVASVTLGALDHNGRMPNIHRESDIMDNVDFKPMHDAVKVAVQMVMKLV